jgi:hypothetical protein
MVMNKVPPHIQCKRDNVPVIVDKGPDHAGRTYAGFYADKLMSSRAGAPGWAVYGVAVGVSARVVRLCAWPDYPPRHYKYANPMINRGWHTKREAAAVAARLNARFA